MESYKTPEVTYIAQEKGSKSLAYTADFKMELEGKEGVMADAKEMIDQMIMMEQMTSTYKPGEELEDEKVKVMHIGNHEKDDNRQYFKVTVKSDNTEYFVKRMNLRGEYHSVPSTGPQELIEMNQLKSDLVGIKGVRVLDYKLGYSDKDVSYCVAKYEEALQTKFNDVLFDEEKISPIKGRYYEVLRLIGEAFERHGRRFSDFGGNVSYDKDKDEFVLFDLYLTSGTLDKDRK